MIIYTLFIERLRGASYALHFETGTFPAIADEPTVCPNAAGGCDVTVVVEPGTSNRIIPLRA